MTKSTELFGERIFQVMVICMIACKDDPEELIKLLRQNLDNVWRARTVIELEQTQPEFKLWELDKEQAAKYATDKLESCYPQLKDKLIIKKLSHLN